MLGYDKLDITFCVIIEKLRVGFVFVRLVLKLCIFFIVYGLIKWLFYYLFIRREFRRRIIIVV